MHTICFGQNFFWTKTVQSRKHYKNRGFSGNCKKKQKWHPFLEKGVFDMVEKVGFTNCVFEKLCVSWKHYFIVFSAKHSFWKTKTVCWKTSKFMKNSGLFLNMAKWCFLGLFFEVLILKGLFLVCLALFQSVKNACFPSFRGFSGVACVCFSFLCCICFCFVCFVIGFVVGCCCFVVCVFLLLFVLFFLEGLRVRWGGPKGHLTWP